MHCPHLRGSNAGARAAEQVAFATNRSGCWDSPRREEIPETALRKERTRHSHCKIHAGANPIGSATILIPRGISHTTDQQVAKPLLFSSSPVPSCVSWPKLSAKLLSQTLYCWGMMQEAERAQLDCQLPSGSCGAGFISSCLVNCVWKPLSDDARGTLRGF